MVLGTINFFRESRNRNILHGLLFICTIVLALRELATESYPQALLAAILCGPVCFYLAYWCRCHVPIFRWYLYFIIAILTIYALLVLCSFCGWHFTCSSHMTFYFSHVERLSIIFSNPNHLGNVLAFGVVVMFGVMAVVTRRWVACISWSVLALLLAGLQATYSRGAWVACVVGIVAAIVSLVRHMVPLRRVVDISLTVLLLAVVLHVTVPQCQAITARMSSSQPSADASVSHRLAVLQGAVRMIYDHAFLGVGIGKFGSMLEQGYKSADIRKESYASAMNNYLTLAAETGIPTVLLYMFTLIDALILAYSGIASYDGISRGLAIGFLCGVLSLLVFGCTTYTLTRIYAQMLIWSILGYLIAGKARQTMECGDVFLGVTRIEG